MKPWMAYLFPHLYSGNTRGNYILGFLRGLNETTHVLPEHMQTFNKWWLYHYFILGNILITHDFNDLGSLMSIGFPRTVDYPPPRCSVLDLTQKSKTGTSQLKATYCTVLNCFSSVQSLSHFPLFVTP